MLWIDRIARVALRSSLLWGALACVGFYAALQFAEPYLNAYLLRCLSGRWESYACVAMFFVGLAELVIRGVDLAPQFLVLRQTLLTGPVAVDQQVAAAQGLVKQLDGLKGIWQQTYLVRRLRDALQDVVRKGSAEELEEQLRYLADMDQSRMYAGYAATRFLSWSIPAMGSLGTVLGIAAAIGSLSVAGASDPLPEVTAGLAIAFDTTALALGLSTILMLVKFVCEQQESQLLVRVEERARRDLSDRLGRLSAARSNEPAQMRQLIEKLVAATDQLAQRATSATPASGGKELSPASAKELESVVAQAVSKAIGTPGNVNITTAPATGGSLVGIEQVQQALQQIATFFQFQQAEQIEQHERVKQLVDIVQETPTKPAGPVKPVRRAAKDNSLVGLWGAGE